MGGGSPVSRNGKYKSIADATNAGIDCLTENAKKSLSMDTDMNNTKNCHKQAKKFLKWVEERNKPKLF